MLDGFKDFISRGSALEMAVGIVIGAAFGAVVTSLVDGIINPLIGAIFGQPNLDKIWTITINESAILPGMVLTTLINFLLVAAAVYFLVVVPANRMAERNKKDEPAAEPEADVALLTEIRDLLARS